jgi:ferric-dicitrate binding protein FerR (iron transport regulator)
MGAEMAGGHGIDGAMVRAWLEGEIGDDDFARLEAALRDPQQARAFLRDLHFDQAVARVAKAQVEGQALGTIQEPAAPPPSARVQRRRARPWRTVATGGGRAVAAMLLAALGLGLAWWRFAPPPVVASLMVNTGEARLGAEQVATGESREVRSGALLELPLHAWSTLCFNDGSVVDVLDATRVVITVSAAGKRLALERGELRGDVRKQPPGRPLVIATPRAETTVIGTRLTVAGGASERVAVDEGRVRVRRVSDQAVVQVGAGETLEVPTAGALTVLHPTRRRVVEEAPSADGLQLWLDADRGISADDQGLVWQWRDQGPLGLHLSQPASDQQPRLLPAAAGRHAAVSFGADGQWLSCTGSWPEFHSYSVALVLRPTTLGTWSQGIGCGWGTFQFHGTGRGEVFTGVGAPGGGIRFTPAQLPAGTLALNAWRRFVITYAEGGGSVFVDGRQVAHIDMPRPAAWRNFHIGRQHPPPAEPRGFDGDVQEVLVYDRALDADEVERLDHRFRQRLEDRP